jgi:hypothetical protein
MSYENQECPCGGKKRRETMLCDDCVREFSDREELKDYLNETLSLDYRRNAALVLLSLAHNRVPGLHKRPGVSTARRR